MSRNRRAGQPLIWPVLLLFGLALVLGAAVTWAGLGLAPEKQALRNIALRTGQSPDWLIQLFQGIAWAADAAQRSLVMIAFAIWLFWQKRWRAGLVMLIFPGISGATSSILKQVFARPRPDVVPHLDSFSNLSFPSGHATNAAAILLLAALIIPARHRGLWIMLAGAGAILVAMSRVMLGVHWPSDVIGGLLWGTGFALAGWATAQKWGDAPR